jgi:hypothetical protein
MMEGREEVELSRTDLPSPLCTPKPFCTKSGGDSGDSGDIVDFIDFSVGAGGDTGGDSHRKR